MARGDEPGPAVLFVDDDELVLGAVRRALAAELYDVVTVTQGQKALDTLAQRRVDVLVSDERMPGMSGGELLSLAADRYPDIFRIMLTGQPTLESALFAINSCHVYHYLLKPFDPVALSGMLRDAIRKRKRIALRSDAHLERLSTRERDVMLLVSRGVRVKDIADQLHISTHTVRNHLKAIFRKLDIHSQAELVLRYGPKAGDA